MVVLLNLLSAELFKNEAKTRGLANKQKGRFHVTIDTEILPFSMFFPMIKNYHLMEFTKILQFSTFLPMIKNFHLNGIYRNNSIFYVRFHDKKLSLDGIY